MAALKKDKTITKLYPAQISTYQDQILIYSPLEHWVELHSSVLIKDVIQIQGDASPYFMNNSNQKIILQNKRTLMSEWLIQQNFSKIAKVYEHDQQFVSETVCFNDEYFVNLDQKGCLCLLSLDSSQYNPQSLKQISTKTSIQLGSIQNIESAINVDTLCKKQKNGFDLAELAIDKQQIFTLHTLEDDEESSIKIFKTDLNQCESITSSLRAYLPSTIKSLLAEDKCIWAYGEDNLLLIDVRSENIVSKMNDILETQINYVKKDAINDNLLYVCRNNSILLQDARKMSQVVEVVLNSEQNIEYFTIIKQDDKDIFCISSAFDGKVHFYQKNQY